MGNDEKKVKIFTITVASVIILILYLSIVAVAMYVFNSDNIITQKTARYFPYPATIVGGKILTINQLKSRVDAARNFYENQNFSDLGMRVDFTTEDGKKRLKIKERNILNKMIEDAIVEKEAQKYDIKLTQADISQEVERKMSEYGSRDEVVSDIKRLYGWTITDFEKNIVRPDIYREKLYEKYVQNNPAYESAKDKIESAKNELQRGADFETAVGKYSEGESAKNRGDLGWFSVEEMLPEIAQAAFPLEKAKTSEIIQSALGYHIIRMEDRKTEEGTEKFHLRQIFVRVPSFFDWLTERKNQTSVYIPLRFYQWNRNSGEAIFRNGKMTDFEKNEKENVDGDISILF